MSELAYLHGDSGAANDYFVRFSMTLYRCVLNHADFKDGVGAGWLSLRRLGEICACRGPFALEIQRARLVGFDVQYVPGQVVRLEYGIRQCKSI